jgi:hypothetical protein
MLNHNTPSRNLLNSCPPFLFLHALFVYFFVQKIIRLNWPKFHPVSAEAFAVVGFISYVIFFPDSGTEGAARTWRSWSRVSKPSSAPSAGPRSGPACSSMPRTTGTALWELSRVSSPPSPSPCFPPFSS